jgi:hypothetical protein
MVSDKKENSEENLGKNCRIDLENGRLVRTFSRDSHSVWRVRTDLRERERERKRVSKHF